MKATAYVELNPVKAGMVNNAWDYRWSSVHAHLAGKDTQGILQAEKLLSFPGNWKTYLVKEAQRTTGNEFEQHERAGRPLGEESFIEKAERFLRRELKKSRVLRAMAGITKYCVPRIFPRILPQNFFSQG